MYKIGERVVYGQTGVCTVADICEKEFIKNSRKTYYVLKPVGSEKDLIFAPVESDRVSVRSLMTKEQAESLINSIPKIVENVPSVDNITKDDYVAKISNHTAKDLVELTAIIYAKKLAVKEQKKKLNVIDEKYMKIGEKLLFGELAEVLSISIEDVPDYIYSKINK